MFHTAAFARAAAIVVASVLTAPVAQAENLLLNPGGEKGKGPNPSIWDRAWVEAKGLVMERSTASPKSGEASLMIANDHEYDQPVANNWMQALQEVPKGAVVRVAAAIRTEDADSANVCLQCWDATGSRMLAFGSTPVIRGDQEWIRVTSGPVIVPPETAQVVVRAALMGKGRVWFDDLEVTAERDAAIGATNGATAADPTSATAPAKFTPEESLKNVLPGRLVEAVPVIQDCMVLAYIPDWQYGEVDNIAVANNEGGVRTLFSWTPLSKELIGGKDRRFYLAAYSRKTTAAEGHQPEQQPPMEITISPLAAPWPESVSWKSQPKTDEKAKPVVTAFEAKDGWKVFDITPLVQEESSANKFGVIVQFADEGKSASPESTWSGYEFVSREGLREWEGRHAQLLVVEGAPGPADGADPKK